MFVCPVPKISHVMMKWCRRASHLGRFTLWNNGRRRAIIQVIAIAKCQRTKILTDTHALFNLFRNVMNYSNSRKIDWNKFDCISENYRENSENKGHTYSKPRPGQYLTHAHNHITGAVAAMDNCFALIGAHHHGISVGSMNGENSCLKYPLLPRRKAAA